MSPRAMQPRQIALVETTAVPTRIEPRVEQDLVGVDAADAGEEALIHERRLDRTACLLHDIERSEPGALLALGRSAKAYRHAAAGHLTSQVRRLPRRDWRPDLAHPGTRSRRSLARRGPAGPMKLTFLGTRGNIDARSPIHRRHTALLVSYRGRDVMIDCGADWRGGLDGVAPPRLRPWHGSDSASGP
jgi:hypothetical protein